MSARPAPAAARRSVPPPTRPRTRGEPRTPPTSTSHSVTRTRAGNGANSTNLNASCNRNTYAVSVPSSREQRPEHRADVRRLRRRARSGDILNNQVNSVTSDTKIVTMTIGGNDIGFTSLIIACTTLGCRDARSTARTTRSTRSCRRSSTPTYAAIRSSRADGPGRHPRLRAPVRAPHVLRRHRRLAVGGGSAQRADGQPQRRRSRRAPRRRASRTPTRIPRGRVTTCARATRSRTG